MVDYGEISSETSFSNIGIRNFLQEVVEQFRKTHKSAKYFRFYLKSEINEVWTDKIYHGSKVLLYLVLDAYGVLAQLQFCYP